VTDIGLLAVSGKTDQQHSTFKVFVGVSRKLRVFANIRTKSQTEVSAIFYKLLQFVIGRLKSEFVLKLPLPLILISVKSLQMVWYSSHLQEKSHFSALDVMHFS